MPIYTKKGDKGKTGLPGKRRVAKTAALVEALGAIDTANAAIGLAAALVQKDAHLVKLLERIQTNLLGIGACLAAEKPQAAAILQHLSNETSALERQIDRWDRRLPELKNFILPGGQAEAATLHLCRTLIRQAERFYHRLSSRPQLISQYLNRLSDFFFEAARYCNYRAGVPDKVWKSHN